MAAVCLAFVSQALAQEAGRQRPARLSLLERYDGLSIADDGTVKTDGEKDGKVSLDEYKAGMLKMAEDRFKAMDKDEDGNLTEEEMRARWRRRPGTGPRRERSKPAPKPEATGEDE
jgi:hypothetical protein